MRNGKGNPLTRLPNYPGGPPPRQKGITISVSAQNFLDRANYSGYSGVMTSQYFLQPTSVANPRQIDFSLRFNF